MKKLYYIALAAILTTVGMHAQMQTAHWYFGINAGLDFSSGSPVIDTNGQISTWEGCTSISDEYGNLLFYTDGRRVYDSTHSLMQNGSGLRGDNSSTTSSVVLPVPDNCSQYYVFTIDIQDPQIPAWRPRRGIEYNIIDMSMNGGLGAVVQKNIEVPLNGIQQGHERLAAISNADKTGYWIVTHFQGNFYSFAVTVTGVDLVPVVSPSPGIQGMGTFNNIGYLKASPDGSKLGMGMNEEQCNDLYLSLYDFDNATGIVSNEILLYKPNASSTINRGFYGIEFSPNSKVLYTTSYNSVCNSGGVAQQIYNEIWQFNLEAPSILDSKYVIENTHYGALQLALDGKIYNANMNGFDYMGMIEDPNTVYNAVTGQAPVYDAQAIYFGPDKLRAGLPTFLNHYFRISITINGLANAGVYCAGDVLDFNFCSQGGAIDSILWDFGDGNTSTEMHPSYQYNTAGNYTVTVTLVVGGEIYMRTIQLEVTGPYAEDAVMKSCATGAGIVFHLSEANTQINPSNDPVSISFYATEGDARNDEELLDDSFTAHTDTTIYVRIENTAGCYVVRKLELIIHPLPLITAETPVEICSGTSTVLVANTSGTSTVNWYGTANGTIPLFVGNSFVTTELATETNYWVEAVSGDGCVSERLRVTVKIQSEAPPYFDLQRTYCLNAFTGPLPNISDNGIRGSWHPSTVDTSSIGTKSYTFTSEAGDCSMSFQLELIIEVVETSTPEFDLLTEYYFVDKPQVLPNISDNGIQGTWYPSFVTTTISETKLYTFVPDEDQCAEVFSIEIKTINYPRFFTPNGDSYNDYWNISGLKNANHAKIMIYDRYGKIITSLRPEGPGWDGTYNGNLMPSTDYWFVLTYQNEEGVHKELKSHFALKR